jgi:hypothetical protein
LLAIGGQVLDLESNVTHSEPQCAIDCRLFIQEQSVVHQFDRTTGALSLYTDNELLAGIEIEYAIRCESVYADSAVTYQSWIQVAGGDAYTTDEPMQRLGDDDALRSSKSDESSCSSDYHAPNYD